MRGGPACDVLVVGGGINGVGIARDAAGRGLSVLLCEKDDLASHTSSWSSKLIHGGLRYLEHYEFRLVREALIEREVLLRAAPTSDPAADASSCRTSPSMRPAWLVRLGLFLYDHLGGREILPGSTAARPGDGARRRAAEAAISPGASPIATACVDDARLVVAQRGRRGRARGHDPAPGPSARGAVREADGWRATLEGPDGPARGAGAALVNAAGPWVSAFLEGELAP